MSYDLYFWVSEATDDPGALAERLADEEAGALAPDPRVLEFRVDLLRRWPDLVDLIGPWHHDLAWRQPWGATDLADRFVVLTLPYGWADTSALPVLAGMHGLDAYDPQTGELRHLLPRSSGQSRSGHGRGGYHSNAVPLVAGWVAEDHVVDLFQHLSGYIGYRYDDLDEGALTGALDDTDDETPDRWFGYPLEGAPRLLVRLARSPGTAVVSVRVEGAMDALLAARVETLLDVL